MFRRNIWPLSRPTGSRLLWIFVGAAGATYLIKRQIWATKLAEWKEKKDIMLDRGREGWDEKKEQVLVRSRQLREEKVSSIFLITNLVLCKSELSSWRK